MPRIPSIISANVGMKEGSWPRVELADRTLTQSCFDVAIVFQHRNLVARQPDITFDAVRAQLEAKLECFDRVFRRMCSTAAVCEGDRILNVRRKTLLHTAGILPVDRWLDAIRRHPRLSDAADHL